ncbi:Acg family FMN-binding oxidoreductase [Streptomyces sp. NPDC050560]|uniref:Acg family FMN-binding oxidoreductase n=1 Tax=Streptomyces sp. NPDC050560 TaxID=3365630 RepID=UPI0037A8F75E
MTTPRIAEVRALVAAAGLAPSMHNAQPWIFRFDPGSGVLDLRADPARAMPATDPEGRGLRIGCGAALFTLRVAAAHTGWRAVWEPLPEPGDPELLARVRLGGVAKVPSAGRTTPLSQHPLGAAGRPEASLGRLFPFIALRHTSREPFSELEVPEAVRRSLAAAARAEGAEIVFPGPWHTDALLELVEDAEREQRSDRRARADVARWTRLTDADAPAAVDGIPRYALGPSRWYGRAPVRDFAADAPVPGRPGAGFEQTPQLALLGTGGDTPRDWLTAGQALGRVLLEATAHGLATSLTSQALEWEDLRRFVRDPMSSMAAVHMVLRLGYGPPGRPTPRRPVDAVFTLAGA